MKGRFSVSRVTQTVTRSNSQLNAEPTQIPNGKLDAKERLAKEKEKKLMKEK